jgi:hypothetical protein
MGPSPKTTVDYFSTLLLLYRNKDPLECLKYETKDLGSNPHPVTEATTTASFLPSYKYSIIH